MNTRRAMAVLSIAAAVVAATSGCSSGSGKKTVTVVTHDSFAVSPAVLSQFEKDTGITVNQVKGGDAGAVVNQAILTKDHPQGDVLYGIDNTLLQKGLDAGLFDPYTSPALASVDKQFDLDPTHHVSPVDESDVCLNYDKTKFGGAGQPPVPASFEDLTSPALANDTVVENPSTSSPGLAFLVATVQHFGENGYLDYWRKLKDNGVKVVDGWDQAYNNEFSVGSGGTGTRPIVVSYATSPPADVVFANPPKQTTDVGVVTETCFRQVEFVGVLHGAAHTHEAQQFVDFMLSKQFQDDVPLQMFVYPVRTDATLPDAFTTFAVRPPDPIVLDVKAIGAGRERWIRDWTGVLG